MHDATNRCPDGINAGECQSGESETREATGAPEWCIRSNSDDRRLHPESCAPLRTGRGVRHFRYRSRAGVAGPELRDRMLRFGMLRRCVSNREAAHCRASSGSTRPHPHEPGDMPSHVSRPPGPCFTDPAVNRAAIRLGRPGQIHAASPSFRARTSAARHLAASALTTAQARIAGADAPIDRGIIPAEKTRQLPVVLRVLNAVATIPTQVSRVAVSTAGRRIISSSCAAR